MNKGLVSLKTIQDKNGNTYEVVTDYDKVFLLSVTKSFKNLLYSSQFNEDYNNQKEDFDNLDEYSFKIVKQESL